MKAKPEYKTTCTACGKTRRREDLRYSVEDLQPYCANMAECVESHPNSYKNFAANQKAIGMVSYKEAMELYKQQLTDAEDTEAVKLLEMTLKPTSVRLTDVKMAEYLHNLKEDRELKSLNATILAIIEDHMKMNLDAEVLNQLDKVKEQKAEEFQQQEQEQTERIEELKAVNKPVYTPEDEDEEDLF